MRLSIVLLAVVLFLLGLEYLGAVTLSSHVFGWLLVINAALFLVDSFVPTVQLPWKHD